MIECRVEDMRTDPAATYGRVRCALERNHAGRHAWETEEEFLERVCPEPIQNRMQAETRVGVLQPFAGPPARCTWCTDPACPSASLGSHWHDLRPETANVEMAIAVQPTSEPGAHYRARGGIEPINFIVSNDLDFLEGNVVKYVARWKHKDGLKDLKKAMQYLQWLLEREEKAAQRRSGVVEAEAHGNDQTKA